MQINGHWTVEKRQLVIRYLTLRPPYVFPECVGGRVVVFAAKRQRMTSTKDEFISKCKSSDAIGRLTV